MGEKKKLLCIVTLLLLGFIMPSNLKSVNAAEDTNTVTVESLGFSISTPVDWKTFLPDTEDFEAASYMEDANALFYALSDDESYRLEVYEESELNSNYYDGVTNLKDATAEEKKTFFNGIEDLVEVLPTSCEMTEEPICSEVTANGVTYVKAEFSFRYNSKMLFICNPYFTVKNGKCICFENYYMSSDEKDTSNINSEFDEIMQTVDWSNSAKAVSNSQTEKNGVWDKISNTDFPMWIFGILLAGILLWTAKKVLTHSKRKNK